MSILCDAFDAVLPLRVGDVVVQRSREVVPYDRDGVVSVTIDYVTMAGSDVVEVVEDNVGLGWPEDEATPDRARAFFEGWARGVRARGPGHGERGWLAPPYFLLEDLDLQSADDFAAAISAARWMQSAPDVSLYPDLRDVEPPIADDAALAAAIEADPSRETFLRYADALGRGGDPRAELIRLQASPLRTDQRRASQWLRGHARYFFGNFPGADPWGHDPYADEIESTWRFGYVDALSVTLRLDRDGPTPEHVLAAIFQWPSARFLRSLSLAVDAYDGEHHPFERWVPLLSHFRRDSLRSLHLQGWNGDPEDPTPLGGAFPRLVKSR